MIDRVLLDMYLENIDLMVSNDIYLYYHDSQDIIVDVDPSESTETNLMLSRGDDILLEETVSLDLFSIVRFTHIPTQTIDDYSRVVKKMLCIDSTKVPKYSFGSIEQGYLFECSESMLYIGDFIDDELGYFSFYKVMEVPVKKIMSALSRYNKSLIIL